MILVPQGGDRKGYIACCPIVGSMRGVRFCYHLLPTLLGGWQQRNFAIALPSGERDAPSTFLIGKGGGFDVPFL